MDFSETEDAFNLIPSNQTQNRPLSYILLPVHPISGGSIDNVSDDEGEEAKETKEGEYENEGTITVSSGEEENIEALQYSDMSMLGNIEIVENESPPYKDENSEEEENIEASRYSTLLMLDSIKEMVESESAPDKDQNEEEEENIEASRYSTFLMLNSIEEYVKCDSASDKYLNKEEENVEALEYSTALVLDSNEEIVESESVPDKDENKHKGCLIEGDNDLVIRDTDLVIRDTDLVIRDTDLVIRDPDLTERDTDLTERDTDLTERGNDLSRTDNDLAIRDSDLTERNNDLAKRDTDLTEIDNDVTESEDDLTESEGDLTESEDDLLEREDCLKVMTDLLEGLGFQYEKGLEVYMLDFITSFVYDVLGDASEYSFKLAGKQEIDMDDVILAMDMLQMKSTVSPWAPELLESKMRQRQVLQTKMEIEFTLPKIPLEPKILLQPKKRQRYCLQKSNSIEFNFPKVPKSKTIGNVHSKAQEKDKSTITEYIGPLFGEDMIPKKDAVEPMDIDDPLTSTFVDHSTSTHVFPSTSTYVAPPTSTDEDQSEIEYVDLSTHRFSNLFTGRRSLNSKSSYKKSRTKPLLKLDKDKCPVSTSKDSEPFLTPLFSL